MSEIFKPLIALGPQKESPSISLSELYHENTKLHPLTAKTLAPSTDFSPSEKQAMTRAFKQYPLAKKIPLPPIKNIPENPKTFDNVIASRRTVRTFNDAPLTQEEFSTILYQSYGITGELSLPGGGTQKWRASPSGGALYPAEIYLGIRRVDQIDPGIYHYNVQDHALELLTEGDLTEEFYQVCCDQEYVKRAAVIFFISGVFQRTKRKYSERGYRYVLLDVGHLGQNIYLSSTSLDLAIMTTCGFFDDPTNELLRLDGIDESVLYVAFVGQKETL